MMKNGQERSLMMIESKTEKIEVNGFTWNWQEIDTPDGNLEAINLYDAEGNFVTEFKDYKEMIHFLKGVMVCE